MFGFKQRSPTDVSVAFSINDLSYSVAAVKNNKQVLFAESRNFKEKMPELITKALVDDVERLQLVGQQCQLILAPGQYQLLSMDAPKVPDVEMDKALRWLIKGQVDYPLNDIALYTFRVPPHGVGKQQKKVFVAVTQLSALKTKLAMFDTAFIDVSAVNIAEYALINLLATTPYEKESPVVLVNREEEACQMQIVFNNQLYLVRELVLSPGTIHEDTPAGHKFLLEIQRSLDYCLGELKLSEPKQILFTPGFYQEESLLHFLAQETGKEMKLINLADSLVLEPPISMEDQQAVFCSIGGALTLPPNEDNSLDE